MVTMQVTSMNWRAGVPILFGYNATTSNPGEAETEMALSGTDNIQVYITFI